MNHPPPPPPRPPRPLPLDATCDRIVAALTRRLRETARQLEETAGPVADHDFLVPVLHPHFTDALGHARR